MKLRLRLLCISLLVSLFSTFNYSKVDSELHRLRLISNPGPECGVNKKPGVEGSIVKPVEVK